MDPSISINVLWTFESPRSWPFFDHETALKLRTFGHINEYLQDLTLPISLQVFTCRSLLSTKLNVIFPPGLQSLTLENGLYHLDQIKCLDTLEFLKLGDFDQPLEGNLPKHLKTLVLGETFNQKLEEIILPQTLQHLDVGMTYNHPLDHVNFPEILSRLTFGDKFNQSFENVKLPNLQDLSLGGFPALEPTLAEHRKFSKNNKTTRLLMLVRVIGKFVEIWWNHFSSSCTT